MRSPASRCVFFCLFLACEGSAPTQPVDDVDTRPPDLERSLVAMGVARLSTRHAAALLSAIEADQRCGFASPAAKASIQLSGMPGDDGTATWSIKDCALSFPDEAVLETDCDGMELRVKGKATVSATRTVHGVITSDADQPLAPDRADSARIEVKVSFEQFQVRDSLSDNSMLVQRGALAFTAIPQLAPSKSVGVCSVATPQLALEGLTITDAEVEIATRGRKLKPVVPSATLDAQIGQGATHENWVAGKVTVWETEVSVPTPNDRDGLDPSYSREKFMSSYACKNELKLPLGGACPPPREKPAQGAAALSVKLFGVVARAMEKDTACGFASQSVKDAVTSMGPLGTKGTATWSVTAPCKLTFPAGTVVETDCAGKETLLSGEVTVTGTKSVNGYLTGDPAEPVVPTSSAPAKIALSLTANSLRLSEAGTTTVMMMKSGTLSGTLEPKTGLDKKSRACSIATPVAHLTLTHQNAQVEVTSGTIGVPLTLSQSTLEAQSGTANGKTNYLAGSVMAAGQMLNVPSAGATPDLDPGYDPVAFDASYRCNADLELPMTEEACSFAEPLAEGAARLLVRNAAAVVQLINTHAGCGFANEDILTEPYLVIGGVGSLGRMGWGANCTVGAYSRVQLSKDCANVVTTVEGLAGVSATRVVDGLRDEQCGGFLDLFCADTIIPLKPDAVVFNIGAQMNNFAVGTDDARLTIKSGGLTAVAKTMQGRRRSNGHFDVATPVAGFDDLKLANATVTMTTGPKTFTFPITAAAINAFSGAFGGKKNSLGGTVTIDAQTVTLGAMELQPNYSQPVFDQNYACTPDLTAPLVP